MCSHYQAFKERTKFEREFHVTLPPYEGVYDVWPTYGAPFIRRPTEADVGDEAVPGREALFGQFGLLPHWAKDKKKFGRRTLNARSETAATLPSFRDAWRKGHRCIIPADAFFEPDWRSGKAVATRISRADGKPMGIAGLWSFLERAINLHDLPEKITIDKSGANTAAIESVKAGACVDILMRQNKFLNIIVEQDHRAVPSIATEPPKSAAWV